MLLIQFLKEYWVIISFFVTELIALIIFAVYIFNAVKCLLRNDILYIYDKCKDKKEITKYQLQSVNLSYSIYKKLKGNSFIDEIMEKIKRFKIID